MKKCALCENETDKTVLDLACGEIPLCDDCKGKFKQCEKCKVAYLDDELDENNICYYCNDEN